MWDLLKSLRGECQVPWVVDGDFNDIWYSFEKRGGVTREARHMEKFQETLEECNLDDLGFTGT